MGGGKTVCADSPTGNHRWDITGSHGICKYCSAEKDFDRVADPKGRDKLKREDRAIIQATKVERYQETIKGTQEAKEVLEKVQIPKENTGTQEKPAVTVTPPLSTMPAETQKAVTEMAGRAAEQLVPPKPPKGNNVGIARYYDANRAAIEADVKAMGVSSMGRKWGMTISTTWQGIRKRWAKADAGSLGGKKTAASHDMREIGKHGGHPRKEKTNPPTPGNPALKPDKNGLIFPHGYLREIIGLSVEIKLEEAGTLKLIYTHNSPNSLSQSDRKFLADLIQLMVEGGKE